MFIDKISLVVNTFNVPPALLRDCLRSIELQTLQADCFETIIVDDCSDQPECLAQLSAFEQRHENAKLIRLESNIGLAGARMVGAQAATGNYVLFLDGDDMIVPHCLERMREVAFEHQADLVSAGFQRWNPELMKLADLRNMSSPLPFNFLARLRAFYGLTLSVSMCGRLWKATLLRDASLVEPKRSHEDISTTLQLMFLVHSVASIDEALYLYTANSESISSSISSKLIDEFFDNYCDAISVATSNGFLERLTDSISQGVDLVTNNLVRRIVGNERLNEEDVCELLAIVSARRQALRQRGFDSAEGNEACQILDTLMQEKATGTGVNLASARKELFGNENTRGHSIQFTHGIGPSIFAKALKARITFVCEVDYQLRNAAVFARELSRRGVNCAVLDKSAIASEGRRQLPAEEAAIFKGIDRIRIDDLHAPIDILATAPLVVFFNDWSPYLPETLTYRRLLKLPTVSYVEGISDFLRADAGTYRAQPYRRTDYVFLAGQHDQRFFADRRTRVIGMPIVESLWSKPCHFPAQPLVVLNVNFTYGVLEHQRETYLQAAMEGFRRAGVDYTITKHPSELADLSSYQVSNLSQYQLIEQCSLFVSRFATGIIEALACGKPAIYFNPHGEIVEKFQEPLGAYEVATNAAELAAAIGHVLGDIDKGVDFRERARPFLEFHTGLQQDKAITGRAADAFMEVYWETIYQNKSGLAAFFQAISPHYNGSLEEGLVGEFSRSDRALFHEEELVAAYFGNARGTMIDVGANVGNVSRSFLANDWHVHAFEPDPSNRKKLIENLGENQQLVINEEAVSNTSGEELPFFASEESTGISSLSAFTSGHSEVCTVRTITLADYCAKHSVDSVDFLKIDVEGHDKFVLEGFPWDQLTPAVVLAEFEDNKTLANGYRIGDLAVLLQQHGYSVYVSEWHPIERYGLAHEWRRILPYDAGLDFASAWGNIIGFREDPGPERMRELALITLKFNHRALHRDAMHAAKAGTIIPPRVKAGLKKALLVTVEVLFSAIKRLERNPRGKRLKRRLEQLYAERVGHVRD